MEKRKQLDMAINALYLVVEKHVADDVKKVVLEALDEEYHRGIEDGKVIQEHGTTNWIT